MRKQNMRRMKAKKNRKAGFREMSFCMDKLVIF